jgi:hypothetical protein
MRNCQKQQTGHEDHWKMRLWQWDHAFIAFYLPQWCFKNTQGKVCGAGARDNGVTQIVFYMQMWCF